MRKRTMRRVLITMAVVAWASFTAGWYAAHKPETFTFIHLEPGSYLATFNSNRDCWNARAAFDAGRHIVGTALLQIGPRGSLEMCASMPVNSQVAN